MKNQVYILIILTLISSKLISQSVDTIYLWPDTVPGEIESKHPAVQTENTTGNVTRLSDVTNPLMAGFKPLPEKDNGASIIICPGGGYNILAVDKEGYEVAKWLSSLGYRAYVLQYRVPKKQAGALQDIQRSIRLIRQTASYQNKDSIPIGLLGFSAGGHLCASASTNYDQLSYKSIDQTDEISSKPDFTILIYAAYLDKGPNRSISPDLKINEQAPPMFIFATADDPHSNGSMVLAKELRDNKVSVELHLLPKGGHGYGLRSGNLAAEAWPKLAEKWLKSLLDN